MCVCVCCVVEREREKKELERKRVEVRRKIEIDEFGAGERCTIPVYNFSVSFNLIAN